MSGPTRKRAGRPERPVAQGGPVADLVAELRRLRLDALLTYDELSQRVAYSKSTLSTALSGRTLPAWQLVERIVVACAPEPTRPLEIERLRTLWTNAREATSDRLTAATATEPDEAMRFEVLGPTRVFAGDDALRITAGCRTVLAVLLARANAPVSLAELVDALWPKHPPALAVKTVQAYIHRLRRFLSQPDRVVLGPGGYSIIVRPGELDAHEFSDDVRDARTAQSDGDFHLAAELFARALKKWRGTPFGDVGSCPFLVPEIQRLVELRINALEGWSESCLRLGRHSELVPTLSSILAENPYRERVAGLLMLALYRSGRQADALDVYQRVHLTLADELGIDPGSELRRTHEAILRGDPELEASSDGEGRRASSRPALLPPDLPSFVGREAELETLLSIAESRPDTVVAIDGMPGVGKTALAVRAAHRLARHYPDGSVFLDLRGFTAGSAPVEPRHALGRLFMSVGTPSLDESLAAWRSNLSNKRCLIVLDNAASEDQLRPLLPTSPHCMVLITSRRKLSDLDDVHPISLDVLPLPASVALFRQLAGPDRLANEPDALVEEVVESCGRLPLALRLAATRFRHRPNWSLSDLADQLRDKQDRLVALEAGRRSVAAAIEASYEQLDAGQQGLFRLLGQVTSTDFDASTVAELVGLDPRRAEQLLESLVDVHLIESRGRSRYTVHPLVWAYAVELAAVSGQRAGRSGDARACWAR